MSATVHLIEGPSETLRNEQLINAFRQAGLGFRSALFLVPTRRLADQIRVSLGNCLAPLIYDLQSFADELIRVYEPTLLPHSDGDRRLLLNEVLSELEDDSLPYYAQVTHMRGFAEAATNYVLELKEAGVDLRELLKSHPHGVESVSKHYQATRIFDRYQHCLARRHRYEPCDRLGRAAGLWEQARRQPFDAVRSVFVAGFKSLTKNQQRLLAAVRETAEHFWVELPEHVVEGVTGPGSVSASPPGGFEQFPSAMQVQMVASSSSPEVLHLIEAAGELGEARLVARHIRRLLNQGIRPERILVTARQFSPATIDLFQEVFDEYDIPHDAEGTNTLGHAPAVAFLLRAWRLPAEDWDFALVASVLRSAYFRPNWPEVRDDPEVVAQAETLLRMLGETRGRDAYLRAVATWEQLPPEPLEDERPEEPLRRRKERLARRCRPFLERFFNSWGTVDSVVTPSIAVAQLRSFAETIGLTLAPPEDVSDLMLFWGELDRWARTETASRRRKLVSREYFARVLNTLVMAPGRARSTRGRGVALLSAERAVGLSCDCLCLVGLGEGSWPDLTAPDSLLDDAERQRLRQNGLALPNPESRLAREQLLFQTLVDAPRRELVLSYAAVDGKGQKLLQSSFLRERLEKCRATSTKSQRMLLDGFFEQDPMSQGELRVQSTRTGKPAPPLAPKVSDNLSRARSIAQARFESPTYSAFDGELREPAILNELAKRVGPDRVFSPTALENYIACPFRFLLQNVLRLEPLEDPSEEVEYTRRGSAFHRALARFHQSAKASDPDPFVGTDLPSTLTEELVHQLDRTVGEYAARAPSRATAELWKLEGKRLERAARRYRDHWNAFRTPWRQRNATPSPHRFEASFGVSGDEASPPLVLTIGDVEVRIGGYIDRVDLVQIEETIGFWVIDYKTGQAANYQAAHVARFEKLQLPLYAMAVERVVLKDSRARPLGLAYWLVSDTGAKPILPAGRNAALAWIDDAEAWPKFSRQLEEWVARIVTHIRAGDFPLAPRSDTCTDTCAFGSACRIAQSRNTGKVFALRLPVIDDQAGAG